MLRSRLYNRISSFIVFIFIFGLYNDNFWVDHFGSNSLKIVFLVFILVNSVRIIRNLADRQLIGGIAPFFIFLALDFFVMIINPPPAGDDQMSRLFENVMLILSMFFIVSFFTNYDLKKTLYYIWITLIGSSIIAFFNSPISQWTFRKTGGTGDPNEFASQILSFLFISIYLFYQNKNIFFLIISIAAFLYSILFAASMSSFIALGALGVLVLIRFLSLSFVKSLIMTITAIVAVLMVIIIYRDSLENVEIVNNILGRTENTKTADTRFNSWHAGLKMIADKPVFGVGMHQYGKYSPKYSDVYLSEDSVAPHNLFLEIIAESGVFVFFAFIFFLFTLLSRYFRTIVHSDYFWIYMAVVSYLFMGLTLGITYNKFFWLTMALLMNIQYSLTVKREEEVVEEYAYTEFKSVKL